MTRIFQKILPVLKSRTKGKKSKNKNKSSFDNLTKLNATEQEWQRTYLTSSCLKVDSKVDLGVRSSRMRLKLKKMKKRI
jgi:hypothetical protein